ncbi:MAG: 3,4-dihydroxy-2-butanone-4-phosphate synthase [Deltaproteobacteria bacterium]|nr:3,4-dihydroxy-2-butanone-4-phosphate synthase [Deltaproteobacteria bacterium]
MHAGRPLDIAVLERVNAAIEDIRQGRMIILVDDEDRENEGDLCFAADKVTPEAINFMAKHGRGLICLTLDEEHVAQLALPMMVAPGRGGPPLGTAFTVSIEAAKGVTTGISAADRAHTIRVAVKPDARPTDVVTPGHVFPLKARRGGVLVRTGQTEGSVDLARLAGFRSAGVICEIMKDDGTMARMPDLEEFGREHGLRILSIADLIQYRLQTETLVRRVAEYPLLLDQTRSEWRAVVYESLVDGRQALALLKGSIDAEPLLCRVHTGSSVADLFASTSTDGGETLRQAIDLIEQEGRGALLYLESQRSLAEELTHAMQSPRGAAPPAAESASSSSDRVRATLRRFGLGAQMLADLGARKLRLLTTSQRKIAGLTGYGIEIVEHVSLHANERG